MKFSCKYIKYFKDLQWENIKYLIKNIHYMTTIFWTLWDNKNIKNKGWRYSRVVKNLFSICEVLDSILSIPSQINN